MGDPRFLGTEQRRRMGAESSHVGMAFSKEDRDAHRVVRHNQAIAFHTDQAAGYRASGRPDLADWHDQEADFHRSELAKYTAPTDSRNGRPLGRVDPRTFLD